MPSNGTPISRTIIWIDAEWIDKRRLASSSHDAVELAVVPGYAKMRAVEAKLVQGTSRMAAALLLLLAAGPAGCDSPTTPSADRALVTFQVSGEQFRVQLNTKDQVDAARRAQQGGAARIPNGRIVTGTRENANWSWHLEDVAFAELTIELCDGRPSDVERGGVQYRRRPLLPLGREHRLDRRELD